jgi:hypothetical protein
LIAFKPTIITAAVTAAWATSRCLVLRHHPKHNMQLKCGKMH